MQTTKSEVDGAVGLTRLELTTDRAGPLMLPDTLALNFRPAQNAPIPSRVVTVMWKLRNPFRELRVSPPMICNPNQG